MQLKAVLLEKGHKFKSETDSEVIAHLIEDLYTGDLTKAVRDAAVKLKGTYGLVVMHKDHPDTLVGARNGSPLILGIGENEMFLASDVTAMISYTKQVVYIEDGEIVTVTPESFKTSALMSRISVKRLMRLTGNVKLLIKKVMSILCLRKFLSRRNQFHGDFLEDLKKIWQQVILAVLI